MSKQLDYDDVDIDEYNPDEEGLNINSDLTEDFAEDGNGDYAGNSKKMNVIKIGIIALVSLSILGGVGFGVNSLIHRSSNKTVQTSNTNANKLFKESISDAVKADKERHNINRLFRNITVEYGKTNDSAKFKKDLLALNDERTSVVESIPTGEKDATELNVLVKDALTNVHKFMNQAYNAKDSESAIDIYNSFNQSDQVYDGDYIDKLTKLLKKNDISYKTQKSDDGTITVVY